MIRSMTGFGHGEAGSGGRSAIVEIRALNHRYADIFVKMSSTYAFAEESVRSEVKAGVGRGKAEVNISVLNAADDDTGISLNESAARQYFLKLRELQDRFDTSGEITLELLASQPDVITQGKPSFDPDEVSSLILAAVGEALAGLDVMRRNEGENLCEVLKMKLKGVESIVKEVAERAPELPAVYAVKLAERISSLPGANEVVEDIVEQRIAVEVALMADKASIDEELVRLGSHILQFEEIISDESETALPVGKKLDFIVQEMNREVNTIGSKAHDLQISKHIIDLKAIIEEIREQVQNIC
ncbi:MAG: YicC family protein [Clostridiales Family XIII bacterium]|jgi:uncharacterized protein (TIGR00255 family)|nr:YicC family protein [Clostridiales Family XIII bacterium]